MLLIRKDNEAVWCKFPYRGTEIEIEVRPADPDRMAEIEKAHTTEEIIEHPTTKTPVRVSKSDDEAIIKDTANYLIKNFKGVGHAADGTPMEATRETKYLLYMLKPLKGERPLNTQINQRSNELRTFVEGEKEKEVKN